LTLGFSYKERPNLYYPLQDPATGIVYPPNPDRIWVYASRDRLKEGQTVQAKTMEEFIELGQILFPKDQRVETWHTMDALLAAIDRGDVPKSGKSPTLRRDLPNLEFWVGRPVGFGRPQFKRYKADLRNQTQPLSSWIVPTFEDGDYEAETSFVSSTNQEGARVVAEIFGDRAFNYAKPLSLIKNLLQQATHPTDIVLDFFAGSGTTGQAVLELNAEEASTGSAQAGQRRFILCSSTEATAKEPDKNLCRDVCAERMRRVIAGYGGKAGYTREQGGEFGYLQLDTVEVADAPFDIDAAHAFQLLALKRLGTISSTATGTLQRLGRVEDCELLLCHAIDADTLTRLAAWPQQTGAARLAVYSRRPDTLREQLAARGVEANCYSLMDALLGGQMSHAGGGTP
jgi:adenine-specific DNA-methyltransferase